MARCVWARPRSIVFRFAGIEARDKGEQKEHETPQMSAGGVEPPSLPDPKGYKDIQRRRWERAALLHGDVYSEVGRRLNSMLPGYLEYDFSERPNISPPVERETRSRAGLAVTQQKKEPPPERQKEELSRHLICHTPITRPVHRTPPQDRPVRSHRGNSDELPGSPRTNHRLEPSLRNARHLLPYVPHLGPSEQRVTRDVRRAVPRHVHVPARDCDTGRLRRVPCELARGRLEHAVVVNPTKPERGVVRADYGGKEDLRGGRIGDLNPRVAAVVEKDSVPVWFDASLRETGAAYWGIPKTSEDEETTIWKRILT
ncbi:hypothetical protein B0H17DRAFT_1260164 [Mycena rosella]|uniref:Uncharacterized protein n=1 Tax=Mycena rosella TaxID=1033263 RepID=A0AAD7DRW0_MYCRO|nr:hypothetical protein B0H17DRAFT_1260164 [Mycena rosella]